MNPRQEKIDANMPQIEILLDDWGYAQRNSPLRSEKKTQVLFWLEHFLPSEIDDALLLLSKIQYKDDHILRRAINLLSAELSRILGPDLAGCGKTREFLGG